MGDVSTASQSIDRVGAGDGPNKPGVHLPTPLGGTGWFADAVPELAGDDVLPDCHFRFGAISATLRTNDAEFNVRFNRIFGDCRQKEPQETAVPAFLQVTCSEASDRVFVEIKPNHDTFDADALSIVSPDWRPMACAVDGPPGSQVFSHTSEPGRKVLAAHESRLVLDRRIPWQSTVAHYFLHHVMRMHRNMLFFHAATIAAGQNGVLLSGPKGAGKSTLSLAMTALGHDFLGDEIASIDGQSGMIWPFPRSVSIRHGPQAQVVSEHLAVRPVERETLPDGTQRMRMPVSELFPASRPRTVPMTHAFFVGELGGQPMARRFDFTRQHLPLLAPLHATVANLPAGARTIRFLRLFGQARCYLLTPGGTPDETAQCINSIVGE